MSDWQRRIADKTQIIQKMIDKNKYASFAFEITPTPLNRLFTARFINCNSHFNDLNVSALAFGDHCCDILLVGRQLPKNLNPDFHLLPTRTNNNALKFMSNRQFKRAISPNLDKHGNNYRNILVYWKSYKNWSVTLLKYNPDVCCLS